jgi:hypothetical protein
MTEFVLERLTDVSRSHENEKDSNNVTVHKITSHFLNDADTPNTHPASQLRPMFVVKDCVWSEKRKSDNWVGWEPAKEDTVK